MILKTLQRSELAQGIFGWQGGDGPSMVLVHGVGLRAEAWAPMVPFLRSRFSLTLVDLPGHGESPAFASQPTIDDYTLKLVGVLNAIQEPSFVVGHSMGALLAMDLAIKTPTRVSAIAPLNAIFRRSGEAKAAVGNRAKEIANGGHSDPVSTLQRWFGNTPKGALKQASDDCRNWLTSVDPLGYKHAYSVFAEEDGPADADLPEIQCPALLVTGSDEPNSTPEMSHLLAQKVKNGQAIIINGARHMMPMTHPELVSKCLIEFHHIQGARHELS